MAKVFLSNFAKGVNVAASPLLLDDNSLYAQNGINTSHKLGAILKDLGYSRPITVAQAGKSILGLFDSRETTSTQRVIFTVDDATSDDTQLFYNNAGTATEITGAETAWTNKAGINVEFENFIGYTFMVGYGATDGFITSASLTDTTFSTSTSVTNMPTAKYIKRYRDRLYIANCAIGATTYPYRVYYSSIPSAGAITWTVASNYFDVDFSEQITGIMPNWDVLIVFTEKDAHYWNQTTWRPLWVTGCSNHRTIVNYGPNMIWANKNGVWVSSGMGSPQNIAGPVIDFIRSGTPTSFFAALVNEEYHLYVGNVTVNGIAYTNVDLTFNFPTASWRWRELTDTMTIFAPVTVSGIDRLYMGDTAGVIWNKSQYTDTSPVYSDSYVTSGYSIPVNAETKPYFFDDPSIRKRLKKVTVIADRALGVQLKMRVFDRNVRALSPYVGLGQLTKYFNVFEGKGLEFNMLQFGFSESSTNEYFSILGIVVEYDVVSIPNISKK